MKLNHVVLAAVSAVALVAISVTAFSFSGELSLRLGSDGIELKTKGQPAEEVKLN